MQDGGWSMRPGSSELCLIPPEIPSTGGEIRGLREVRALRSSHQEGA